MNKPSALVVEDDPDIAYIFSKVLESAGFETGIAAAGDVALERLASATPDVVTLDLNLPGVPGEHILRHIRGDVRMADTKVIVVTAYPHLTDTLEADADLVLVKPIGYAQLRDLAQRLILGASLSVQ